MAETSDRYDGIPNLAPIGTWIKDKGADFFAKPIFSTETYEVQDDPLFSIYLRPGARRDKPIRATREVVSGFPQVRYIHQPNRKEGAARNNGAAHA